MLERLARGLRSAFDKLLGSIAIDRRLLEEVLLDIEKALLRADVNVRLARELSKRIGERAAKEKPPKGTTHREHVLKIVYEELVRFLGKEYEPLRPTKKPFVILMVGLLGSGKTTSCIKLARFFQKQGYGVGLVCADPYRPASLEQLRQLAKGHGIPVYGEVGERDATRLALNGVRRFAKKDIIIIDTAGRHKRAERLMQEIKRMNELIKPNEVVLVMDATIGQAAKPQAEAFQKVVGIGSILVAKFDGTAKGGGVLSACSATGARVRFIGTGEGVDDLEPYHPDRFVSRMLGLGDLQGLLERARKAELRPEIAERVVRADFTLEDFYEQFKALQQMGSLNQLFQMIPGIGAKIPRELVEQQEEKIKAFRYIIDSMTPEERNDPGIMNQSRIKRVAQGSGRSEAEVRELLSQYQRARKLMRQLGGIRALRQGKLKQVLKRFGLRS